MTVQRVNPSLVVGALVLLAATVLQQGAISHASVASVRPDVVMLLVVNWSILRGVEAGMLWGLVGGLFVDMFSGLPFGTSSAGYVAVAVLLRLTERAFIRAHLLMPLITAFMATLVYYAVAFVVVASASHEYFLGQVFLRTVLGVAIFNAVVNPFLYAGMEALDSLLRPAVPRTSM